MKFLIDDFALLYCKNKFELLYLISDVWDKIKETIFYIQITANKVVDTGGHI